MGVLTDKVAIVTGAGRGIGRAEAIALAAQGAKVIVNDVGGALRGEGQDAGPAAEVVEEIRAAGGEAVANTDDIAEWEGGQRLVAQAVETYGSLDILVNNAGIVRDRIAFNLEEDDWDAVIRVHLKGHFVPTRFAVSHWRKRHKETGARLKATVINTTSESGLWGNAGQLNYVAAKAGIAGMTIALARECERFGVRVNAVAPMALTRMTEEVMADRLDDRRRSALRPDSVAAMVCWLASDLASDVNGQVIKVLGGFAQTLRGWRGLPAARSEDLPWTVASIDAAKGVLFAEDGPGLAPYFLTHLEAADASS